LDCRRIGKFAAPMTDIDVPQARKTVDIFAALGIAQNRALPLDNDERLPVVIGVVQRMNEIAPVAFEQLRGAVHIPSYPPSARPIPLPRSRRNALRFWPARSRLPRGARGTGQPLWTGPLTLRLRD